MDISDTCRGCLKQEGTMYPIYDEYENNITLSSLLKKFLESQLSPEDGFPASLCEECAHTVIEFYNFSVIYKESEKNLQKAFNVLLSDKDRIEARHDLDCIDFKSENNEKSNENSQVFVSIFVKPEHNIDLQIYDNEEIKHPITYEQVLKVDNYIKVDNELKEENAPDSTTVELEFKNEKKKRDNCLPNETDGKQVFEKFPRYECKDCGDVYIHSKSFLKHMSVKHKQQNINPDDHCTIILKPMHRVEQEAIDYPYIPVLRCKSCPDQFEKLDELHAHMKNHNKPKPFVCEICGKAFSKKAYLTDHCEVHSKDKRYECKFCKKRFQRRTVLAKHKKIHTNPRGLICEICGQGFTDKGTLKTHNMLIHKKERKYKCLICNLTFPLKATLEKHIFRHQRQNKEKTFVCSVCNSKYYDSSSLKRHYESKHSCEGGVKVSCDQCGKEYTMKSTLKKHIEKVHQITLKLDD